jgi:hypothetical protein
MDSDISHRSAPERIFKARAAASAKAISNLGHDGTRELHWYCVANLIILAASIAVEAE